MKMPDEIEPAEILFSEASELSLQHILVCKLVIWFGAGVLVYMTASLLAVSTSSFQTLRATVLSCVPPGYEDRFTPALFSKIIFALRFFSAVFGVSALLIVFFARRLSRILLSKVRDLRELGQELWTLAYSLRNDPPGHVLSLIAVLIWGIALRLAFLGEPIRNDEAYSFMHYASRPIAVGLTYYTANNHLLNTLLMHFSTAMFGASAWAVRLPTLIAGILIVPATYAVVRLYHGSRPALLAAAFAGASSPLIEYSFNARGYTLGALFFLLMTMLIGFDGRKGSRGMWIVLPVTAALALYSVPTMLYGVAGIFLYLLLRRSALRQVVITMISTAVFTLILYSPALATVGPSAITGNQWVAPLPRDQWLGEFIRQTASLWQYWNLGLPTFVSMLIAAGAIAGLLFRRSLRLPPLAVLLCVAVSALVLMPIQRLVIPRRAWLFLLPLFFGASGTGWNILIRKFRFPEQAFAVLTLFLAAWMGWTVLITKSVRHTGLETAGPRSVEPVAMGSRPYLLRGAQFICSDYFDSGLDFEMRVHRIPYRPSPTGSLLIVTPAGSAPQRTLQLAGLSGNDVLFLHKIAHYEDADVYLGKRGPSLPFRPRGSTEMGVFTQAAN